MWRKKRRLKIKQESNNDCGAACFSSIVAYYGGDISVELSRELCYTQRTGTSLKNIAEGARRIGLMADGYKVSDLNELDTRKLPLILHVQSAQGLWHYIVLLEVLLKKAVLYYKCMDPASGIKLFTREELRNCWVSGVCLHLYPSNEFRPVKFGLLQKMKWIRNLLKGEANQFIAIFFMGTLVAFLNIMLTLFLQQVVDDFIPHQRLQKLQIGLILLLLLLVGKEYITRIRLELIIRQSAQFNVKMFSWFCNRLFSFPISYFEKRTIADFTVRFRDAQKIQQFIMALFSTVLIDVIMLVVAAVLLLSYDWRIGSVVLLFSPFYIWYLSKYAGALQHKQLRVIGKNTAFEQRFISAITSIGTFKLFGKEVLLSNSISNKNGDYQQSIKDYGSASGSLGLLSGLICAPVLLWVVYMGAAATISGQNSVGEFVTIIGLVSLLFPLLTNLTLMVVPFNEAAIALNRLAEFDLLKPAETGDQFEVGAIEVITCTKLHPVSPMEIPRAERINGRFQKGELIAVVGENGSGKTTFLSILAKVQEAYGGSIQINNQYQLKDISFSSWIKKIAVVPQEVQLLEGSILENIAFEDAYFRTASVIEFLEAIGLVQKFNQLPMGIYTVVGAGEAVLSGGQKQLIGIARALYKRPEVLLLDEVTASLDAVTEKQVHKLLYTLRAGMLIFCVTHKNDEFLKACDQVIQVSK